MKIKLPNSLSSKLPFYLLFLFVFLLINSSQAQTIVSKKKGNWSDGATWIGGVAPGPGDNVLIADGHRVNIDINCACNNLTVGSSSLAKSTLEFRGAARSFTVFGNAIINAVDTFDIKKNANTLTTHTVTFFGDVINNGGLQFNPLPIARAITRFMKNGNQTVSGTGSFSKFYDIEVNMGSSSANILELSVANFTAPVNFLKLYNGTFKISTTNIQSLTTFTNATTIPSTAGLWLNSANVNVSALNSITNNGTITISAGTLNVGITTSQDLLYTGGSINMAAGVINVAGKYSGSNITNLTISGGTMNLNTQGSNDLVSAPFQLGNPGSQFNMSGGAIIIHREGGTGAQDLGYVNLAGSGIVTGGTLQIGSATSPASQVMNINSTALIPNLVLNNSTATASLLTNGISVVNTINITLGIFNSNNLSITLGGNWQSNGGTFVPGTSSVHFSGASAATIFKTGGEIFNDVIFSNTGIKTLLSPITASNVTINAGSTFASGTFSAAVLGNWVNNGGTFAPGTSTVAFTSASPQTIFKAAGETFNHLIFSNAGSKTLLSSISGNNLIINSGTSFLANSFSVSLIGNWVNNGGLFNPGTGIVLLNGTSPQSIFKSGGETFNHLGFSGAGVKSFSSAIITNGNFSISAGSSVDVSSSNHQLNVKGNLINSGTFNTNSGTVLFDGTLAHTIGGSSTTNFFNITLANTANGITLTNPQNLIGTLTLSGGTFNTNLQMFTMVSTATATARIAQITGTGDITGPVRVQRFVPGGTTGWALWGTPISSALSFADWDDNIAISCPTCPDGYVANFPSIYSYSEAAVGTYSDYAAYIPINTINDPIVANTGYWVYVGDGFTTTNPITVDVIGTVRKGNQTIPLGYTNYGSPADDGWNLIHNPYPSPISWTALKGATGNIDNAIYVYNADLNGGAGGNATFVNGVSSPAMGSGGIGDNIPMSQGFYVHSTGATQLNATEANKVASAQVYLREASQTTPQLVRINMSSNNTYNFNDEVVIYNQVGASTNFDNDYDAVKMAGQDPYAPFILIEEGNAQMQVNGVAPIAGTFTTSLKTLTGYNGSYTISLSELTLPLGACVNLFDKFTNTSTDLVSGNYVFNLLDTTTVARFILSITLNPLQITANVTQPSCEVFNSGKIQVIGNNGGPWNYYWKDGLGNPIKTSLNVAGFDTLSGLYTGAYQLEITTVGGCDNDQSAYTIIENHKAYSSFNAVDTCFIDQDPIVTFENTTPHAVSQTWDFGDSNSSTAFSTQNQYLAIGNYLVRLISNSSTGCIDTASKNIVVANKPVGIKTNSFNGGLKVRTLSNSHYILEQELKALGNLSYILRDVQAKPVLVQSKHSVNRVYIDLDLSELAPGVYFLTLELNDRTSVIKLSVN